jgi:methionyl-tRNA formyltransferase
VEEELAIFDRGGVELRELRRPNGEPLHAGQLWHAADEARLFLICRGGAVEVLELQPPGKRRMPAADWLRGLREPLRMVDPPAEPT